MRIWGLLSILLVTACTVPEWLGNEDAREKPLPGERIAVLDYHLNLTPDPMIEEEVIELLPPKLNREFPFETALQDIGADQLGVRGLEEHESASIGEGYEWETPIVPQPVIAEGLLFAMDARGYISAHRLEQVDEIVWRSGVAVREDEPEITGGGLAYYQGSLFVTTGYGEVAALKAATGDVLWQQHLDVPFRAPATPGGDKVYAISIENQLYAFDAKKGRIEWTHQGIKESALYLGSMSPAYHNGIVLAGYTSGELFALRAEDGYALWSDTLNISRRTSAANVSGIDATPLVRNGIVYALSNNGLMVAGHLGTGRGVWDLEISGYQTPWICKDYIFVLSSDLQLVALHRASKSIKWITDLRAEDSEQQRRFTAPVVVNGAVLLISNAGEALVFDINSGMQVQQADVVDGVLASPVIAQGALYLLSSDARITRYE